MNEGLDQNAETGNFEALLRHRGRLVPRFDASIDEEPSPQLDQRGLARARVRPRPRCAAPWRHPAPHPKRHYRGPRWAVPVALAATVLLAVRSIAVDPARNDTVLAPRADAPQPACSPNRTSAPPAISDPQRRHWRAIPQAKGRPRLRRARGPRGRGGIVPRRGATAGARARRSTAAARLLHPQRPHRHPRLPRPPPRPRADAAGAMPRRPAWPADNRAERRVSGARRSAARREVGGRCSAARPASGDAPRQSATSGAGCDATMIRSRGSPQSSACDRAGIWRPRAANSPHFSAAIRTSICRSRSGRCNPHSRAGLELTTPLTRAADAKAPPID